MSVNITWSDSNGGLSYDEPVVHGVAVAQGDNTTAKTIYLNHDGASVITGCGIYLRAKQSSYGGDATADADLAELLAWGDDVDADDWGGACINLNATGSFAEASWPTLANKTTVDTYGYNIRTGVGDSSSTTIPIKTVTGASVSGEIPIGSNPNVRFQMRINVPTTVGSSGTREFETVLKYTATS